MNKGTTKKQYEVRRETKEQWKQKRKRTENMRCGVKEEK